MAISTCRPAAASSSGRPRSFSADLVRRAASAVFSQLLSRARSRMHGDRYEQGYPRHHIRMAICLLGYIGGCSSDDHLAIQLSSRGTILDWYAAGRLICGAVVCLRNGLSTAVHFRYQRADRMPVRARAFSDHNCKPSTRLARYRPESNRHCHRRLGRLGSEQTLENCLKQQFAEAPALSEISLLGWRLRQVAIIGILDIQTVMPQSSSFAVALEGELAIDLYDSFG